MSIEDTLKKRGEVYGNYLQQATITNDLITRMAKTPNWPKLLPDQEDALCMVACKIARILNGNPNYADNWIDIAGYATLVAARLEAEEST